MHCRLDCGRLHRKCSPYIRSRVNHEAAIRCPGRIDRVFLKEASGGSAVNRHAVEMRDAIITRRGGNRVAVGRPRRIALQFERISHNPRIRAIGLHRVQKRLPLLPDRECYILSVGRDSRAANDARSLPAPQFRASSVCELPNTRARAGRRNIQEIIWAQSWGDPRARRQRDSSSPGRLRGRITDPQSPKARLRTSVCDHQTAAVSGRRQRRISAKARGQPVRDAPLDIHAIKPRTRSVAIISQIYQCPPIQQDWITHATRVRRDSLRFPATRVLMRQMSNLSGRVPSTK